MKHLAILILFFTMFSYAHIEGCDNIIAKGSTNDVMTNVTEKSCLQDIMKNYKSSLPNKRTVISQKFSLPIVHAIDAKRSLA